MRDWKQTIDEYAAAHLEETIALTETLCRIPAPSGLERKRAEFCKQWLKNHGAGCVSIDAADNAVLELNASDSSALTVFMAHTDTVFPDREPMEVCREGGRMHCPGVCDDTANLAVLLMAARFLAEHGVQPKRGFVLAANSGEEGLGNLRGCRQLMKTYSGRVARLISFDGYENRLWNRAVGSARYRVTVRTEGGHSFRDFGRDNAIAVLSRIITQLYEIRPAFGPAGSTTTYNVGVIEGGTSVNTIAQQASVLYEYRSDDAEGLRGMERAFREVLAEWSGRGIRVEVEELGVRPCAEGVDEAAQQALTETALDILRRNTGEDVTVESASTDCNIPLSMGIPAVSYGLCRGDGAHTRQEWLDMASLERGLRIAMESMLHWA